LLIVASFVVFIAGGKHNPQNIGGWQALDKNESVSRVRAQKVSLILTMCAIMCAIKIVYGVVYHINYLEDLHVCKSGGSFSPFGSPFFGKVASYRHRE
jgi:hypothetical protein